MHATGRDGLGQRAALNAAGSQEKSGHGWTTGAGARDAFETANTHISNSNTVDADHPQLLAARAQMRGAGARSQNVSSE
jgi:hypothetical protein